METKKHSNQFYSQSSFIPDADAVKNSATSPRSVNRLIQQIKNLSRLVESQEAILCQLEAQIDQLGSQRKEYDYDDAVYDGNDSKCGL